MPQMDQVMQSSKRPNIRCGFQFDASKMKDPTLKSFNWFAFSW
jgi:hypothetical protein